MRKAVILFNLGGPDSQESVEPFLFNLFYDPEILSLPKILRYFMAKIISKKRKSTAQKIYAEIGGSSPILKLTNDQSKALENKLNENINKDIYKCFVVMRCWHPRASQVVNLVKDYNADEIILLPLYPQYSSTTSGSSIKEWLEVSKKNKINKPTKIICCYSTDDNFIIAHTKLIKETIQNLNSYKLIFSAHGLPDRNIKKGDPYQWQVEQSVNKIIEKFGGIDICVFGTGMHDPKSEKRFNLNKIREIMEVNYFGTMNSINSIYEYFSEKKNGQISIISSVEAKAEGGTDKPVESEKAPCSIASFANLFIIFISSYVAFLFSTEPEAI